MYTARAKKKYKTIEFKKEKIKIANKSINALKNKKYFSLNILSNTKGTITKKINIISIA